jgi:hypothetical protein
MIEQSVYIRQQIYLKQIDRMIANIDQVCSCYTNTYTTVHIHKPSDEAIKPKIIKQAIGFG